MKGIVLYVIVSVMISVRCKTYDSPFSEPQTLGGIIDEMMHSAHSLKTPQSFRNTTDNKNKLQYCIEWCEDTFSSDYTLRECEKICMDYEGACPAEDRSACKSMSFRGDYSFYTSDWDKLCTEFCPRGGVQLQAIFIAVGICCFYTSMSMLCHFRRFVGLYGQAHVVDDGLGENCTEYSYGGWFFLRVAEDRGGDCCQGCCVGLILMYLMMASIAGIILTFSVRSDSKPGTGVVVAMLVLLVLGTLLLLVGCLGFYPCLRTGAPYNNLTIINYAVVNNGLVSHKIARPVRHSSRTCNISILWNTLLLKFGAGLFIGSVFGLIDIIFTSIKPETIMIAVVLVLAGYFGSMVFLCHWLCCRSVCGCCWCTCLFDGGCYNACFPVLPCHDSIPCFKPITEDWAQGAEMGGNSA